MPLQCMNVRHATLLFCAEGVNVQMLGAGKEENEMNKIVALSGVYDSGKTSVLLALLARLKGTQGVMTLKNRSTVQVVYGNDRREVLQYKIAGKTFSIGVCTGGDTKAIIRDNFIFFAGNKCDICITACRATASSDTVKEVITQAGVLIPYFVAKMKTAIKRQRQVDLNTVDQLMGMIP